jgi:uncharacterized membrane protein
MTIRRVVALIVLLLAVLGASMYVLSRPMKEMVSGAVLLVCLLVLWRMSVWLRRAYKAGKEASNGRPDAGASEDSNPGQDR